MSSGRLRRWARREYVWRLLGQKRRRRGRPRLASHLTLDLLAATRLNRREESYNQRVIDELGAQSPAEPEQP